MRQKDHTITAFTDQALTERDVYAIMWGDEIR